MQFRDLLDRDRLAELQDMVLADSNNPNLPDGQCTPTRHTTRW
jgi:hypothetical protein